MIDRLLGGRYRIITTLGSGGFSQTYVAEDTHRPGNPKCAVKHLQPTNSNQNFLQSARRLFQSEAETLEKLGHHDRIPRLLAYFEENQEFYLVQEFVQGQLLTEKLQPKQYWTENQVWEFIQEILEILVFIHSQGFIHRDIKPSNIIQRQEDNKLVLVDFGSVKQNWTQLLSLTANIELPATVGIGTPGYMPMEQARGRPRPNSDIYALGAIAVQALTGLYPMQLEEDSATGELLWQDSAQVSEALATIVTKMVRYHFKDRYETATEALAEVQQLAPFYLPTEISLELPVLPQISLAPQIALENQSTQNSHSSVITATNPTHTTAIAQPLELATNRSIIPTTTVFSPLKPRPLFFTRWPYYCTIGAALVALGASYAIVWQPRLKLERTLEQVQNLKATGKYSECILRAATIPQNSSLYADAQNVLYECKLTEAKSLAASGDFKAAIALVSSLTTNTVIYQQAKPLISQWSNSILARATDKYQAGKPKEAISIAQDILPTSPVYQKAQATIKQWQADVSKNNSNSTTIPKPAIAQTKPTVPAASKVIPSPSTSKPTIASKPKSYATPTKKVINKSPSTSKPTIASKPKSYATPTKKVINKSLSISKPTRIASKPKIYTSQTSSPTKRILRSRAVIASPKMAKSTTVKPKVFNSRKYLQFRKKVTLNNRPKSQTKKPIKRLIKTARNNYNRKQTYRWTTKTLH